MEQQRVEHKLRKWRKGKGLTLAHCAKQVGTSKPVWFSWETGKYKPNATFMPRVREFTQGEVTADDFFPNIKEAA